MKTSDTGRHPGGHLRSFNRLPVIDYASLQRRSTDSNRDRSGCVCKVLHYRSSDAILILEKCIMSAGRGAPPCALTKDNYPVQPVTSIILSESVSGKLLIVGADQRIRPFFDRFTGGGIRRCPPTETLNRPFQIRCEKRVCKHAPVYLTENRVAQSTAGNPIARTE